MGRGTGKARDARPRRDGRGSQWARDALPRRGRARIPVEGAFALKVRAWPADRYENLQMKSDESCAPAAATTTPSPGLEGK
jgi:hypothetical protein